MEPKPAKIRKLLEQLKAATLQTFPHHLQDLDVSENQGVYVIYDPAGRTVCHVGCTYRGRRGLYQRIRNHMQSQSSFTLADRRWRGMKLRGKYKFRCLEVHNFRERLFLEALAVGSLCPEHIGSHQKKTI